MGNLFTQVEKTIEILRIKYLENRFYYDGIRRDYLGLHTQLRVYDNKLWLWNAGKLPDEITFEKLKKAHLSCPRNELLADVFFKTGYIEAWGRGTVKIIEVCRKGKLPDPEFSELTGGFLVTFFKAQIAEKAVNKVLDTKGERLAESAEKVLIAIAANPHIKTHEILDKTQLAQRTIEKVIAALKKEGILKRVGPDKGGHWEVKI